MARVRKLKVDSLCIGGPPKMDGKIVQTGGSQWFSVTGPYKGTMHHLYERVVPGVYAFRRSFKNQRDFWDFMKKRARRDIDGNPSST